MKQFNVVFGGAVSGGHKVEEVKKNLANLFKADEKKIDQLFETPQVVLKRNIDYDQAMKYQTALQCAGAICDVEEVIQNIGQQAAATPGPPPIPQSSDVHMVGGKRQSVHKSDPQAQTHKKSNRGPYLIIFGVAMILLRVFSIAFKGSPGFMDLFQGGLGVYLLISGIRKVAKPKQS
jgi:hypothetical protein